MPHATGLSPQRGAGESPHGAPGQDLGAAPDQPLCVDLDGTLVRTNTMHDAAFSAVVADWRVLLWLPAWLAAGSARLKQELAARWRFAAAQLPYNEGVLGLIAQERARGRRIVLCTAADRQVADAVAQHLGVFDEVIASDGVNNYRGAGKAAELCRRLGEGGFIYAGNDATDHAVWQSAGGAVVVNAPAAVQRDAVRRHLVAAVIDDRTSRLRAALRALRPYQWVKNLFALVPMFTAGDFANATAWGHSLAIMAAFCATASAVYLVNDLTDLAADRAHPRKRLRPFASGALPLVAGVAMAPALLLIGAVLGIASGAWLALALYAALSLAYTLRLKEQPLVDVFILAALYTIRLFGGGEASGHRVSIWLLGFSSFLFLSLALVKRVSELYRLQSASLRRAERRGYTVDDLAILQAFGCASSFASVVVLSLYVQSDTALRAYARPALLWGMIPLLLFWQCRLWLSTSRGYMDDDPIMYAARDWVSWLAFLGMAIVGVAAWVPL